MNLFAILAADALMVSTTAATASKKGVWLVIAGLVAVPIVAVVLVVAFGGPEPAERRAKREAPAVQPAANEPEPQPEPEARFQPGTLDTLEEGEPEAEPEGREEEPSAAVAEKIAEARSVENTDPERARQLLREALQLDPHNETALESLATKLLIDENHAEARELASRCKRVNSSNDACASVDEFTTEQGPAVKKFVEGAEECIKRTPDNPVCLYGMVNYHLLEGRPNDAAIFVGRLTQSNPNNSLSQLARGRVAGATGEYGEAKSYFEYACKQNNKHACFKADVLRGEGW